MVLVLLGLVSVFYEFPGVHGDPGLFGFGGFCGSGLGGGMFHGCGEVLPLLVNVFLWISWGRVVLW